MMLKHLSSKMRLSCTGGPKYLQKSVFISVQNQPFSTKHHVFGNEGKSSKNFRFFTLAAVGSLCAYSYLRENLEQNEVL